MEGIKAVADSEDDNYFLQVTDDSEQKKMLSEIATEAMEIESADRQRDMESIEMFRFNDAEVEQYRDGFGLAQGGLSGAMKFLVETFFLSRESAEADSATFGKEAISMARNQAESAAAFGWLVTKGNTRSDQVKIGRVYNRINLTATALGVAMHPMSQALQEYSDMNGLQKRLKGYLEIPDSHTIQMFFRLGIAEPVAHGPRRAIADLLRG